MNGQYVDLHVHSCFSDGGLTPEELVATARENGVGVLAVADHDVIEGSLRARDWCAAAGIRHIPGVELDALEGDNNVHVLAYGFDPGCEPFLRFVQRLRFLLDEQNARLIRAMEGDFPQISLRDYADFTHDVRLGGWKALHYLVARGLSASLKESMRFYGQYGVTYASSGYPGVAAVCREIRRAGGRGVLAHPGVTLNTEDPARFAAELGRFLDLGPDGVECYYPKHSPAVTRACLDACRKRGLLVTAGSDCHGPFGSARMGEVQVTPGELVLDGLLPGA